MPVNATQREQIRGFGKGQWGIGDLRPSTPARLGAAAHQADQDRRLVLGTPKGGAWSILRQHALVGVVDESARCFTEQVDVELVWGHAAADAARGAAEVLGRMGSGTDRLMSQMAVSTAAEPRSRVFVLEDNKVRHDELVDAATKRLGAAAATHWRDPFCGRYACGRCDAK